jgi:hypothetical protein
MIQHFLYTPTPDWQDTLWKFLPLFASLIVVFVGSWLTGRAKRREWIADNQKEEYRKVLAGLNHLNMFLIQSKAGISLDMQEMKHAMEETSIAFNTSLFITDFLERSQVAGNVLDASKKFMSDGNYDDYQKEYWKAVNLILSAAKKIKI